MRGTGARGGADPPEGAAADGFARRAALRWGWLFTDQAVPSAGISGTLLLVRGMQRRGISPRDAVSAVLAILGRRSELTLPILAPAALLGVLALARREAGRGSALAVQA